MFSTTKILVWLPNHHVKIMKTEVNAAENSSLPSLNSLVIHLKSLWNMFIIQNNIHRMSFNYVHELNVHRLSPSWWLLSVHTLKLHISIRRIECSKVWKGKGGMEGWGGRNEVKNRETHSFLAAWYRSECPLGNSSSPWDKTGWVLAWDRAQNRKAESGKPQRTENRC